MVLPMAMMVGLAGAAAVAAGTSALVKKKRQRDAAKKVAAYRAMIYRDAYRSIRTPGYAHITSDDVRHHGNRNMRDVMLRNAKYRFSNRFAFRSSIWDLEQFLR